MQSLTDSLRKISLAKPKKWIRFPVVESSSEEEEQIARQTHSNLEFQEGELGIIAMDIDKFEQKINEIRAKISQLRWDSVNILTKEITGKLTDELSWLDIEQNISRLENESHELEIKRRAAVVRLQNKILGNTFGADQKELLPLLPTSPTASMHFKSEASITFFDGAVTTTKSIQFSIPTPKETEASKVEELSTQKEEHYYAKEEKPNEN